MDEKKFLDIEYETESKYGFGCGYWNVCIEHDCACALTSKGFDKEIYEKMRKQMHEEF